MQSLVPFLVVLFEILLACIQTRQDLGLCRTMLGEAEKKFWGCPELVDSLIPFLDTYSTICLARAHKPVLDVILGKTAWNKLIKQVCHGMARYQVMAWYQVTNILRSSFMS